MTNEKLAQAIDLSKQITDLEKIIQSGKKQNCEWIEFTFGNGSNRENVCNDKKIIQSIRDLIVRENELKLAQLKKDFNDL
jgi:predicted RNA-binding protein